MHDRRQPCGTIGPGRFGRKKSGWPGSLTRHRWIHQFAFLPKYHYGGPQKTRPNVVGESRWILHSFLRVQSVGPIYYGPPVTATFLYRLSGKLEANRVAHSEPFFDPFRAPVPCRGQNLSNSTVNSLSPKRD